MKYTAQGNAVNSRFLNVPFIGIFIYFLNHSKFYGQGSHQNWGSIDLWKRWDDFTFDKRFIWRNWYFFHKALVEDQKSKIILFRNSPTPSIDEKWNEANLDKKLFLWRTGKVVYFAWRYHHEKIKIFTGWNSTFY